MLDGPSFVVMVVDIKKNGATSNTRFLRSFTCVLRVYYERRYIDYCVVICREMSLIWGVS